MMSEPLGFSFIQHYVSCESNDNFKIYYKNIMNELMFLNNQILNFCPNKLVKNIIEESKNLTSIYYSMYYVANYGPNFSSGRFINTKLPQGFSSFILDILKTYKKDSDEYNRILYGINLNPNENTTAKHKSAKFKYFYEFYTSPKKLDF